MSFNIRYDNPWDGVNIWSNRKELVFDLLRNSDCDFICLQEAVMNQYIDLENAIFEYKALGRSREQDPRSGEACPIFYKHNAWEWLDNETFWLSHTPNLPATTYGEMIPRVVTWAKFRNKSTYKEIHIINTHFPYESIKLQLKAAQHVITYINEKCQNQPVILCGDFNATEQSEVIRLFLSNSMLDLYRAVNKNNKGLGTFHDWTGSQKGDRIDFIFSKNNIIPLNSLIVHYSQNNKFPSDHFPVVAEIETYEQ